MPMPPKPDGQSPELGRLLVQLEDLDAEFDDYYLDSVAGWNLALGPIRLRRRLGSQRIAHLYIAFCALAFIAGALLAALPPLIELGVALVVGSIFAGGSFLSQVWIVQTEKERALHAEVYGAKRRQYLLGLLRQRRKLVARIERLHPGYFDDQD